MSDNFPLRPVMIIGSMKAGTTSLFHYLSKHPQVCPAIEKEPTYFIDGPYHREPRPPYASCFRIDPDRHTVSLEASIAYTQWPYVTDPARNIFDYGLQPKLIYLARDPIDRLESQYNYTMYTPEYHFPLVGERPLRVSDYAYQLAPFRRRFGRAAIHVVDFATLVSDPSRVCNEVTNFVGLPAFDYGSQDLKRMNRTIPTSERRRRFAKVLSPLLPYVPITWKTTAKGLLTPPGKARQATHYD